MYEKNLGLTVTDKVTGMKGVVVSTTSYIYGSDRASIQPPKDKSDKVPDEVTCDVCQLIINEDKRIIDIPAFKEKIKHGQKVRCLLSGYEGIVYGIGYYMNGCKRIGLLRHVKENKNKKIEEIVWLDEDGLEILEKKTVLKRNTETGGPAKALDKRRF